MNMLMRMMKHAGLSGAVALLAACSGVGEGNTVKTMALAFTPVDVRDQAAVSDATVPRLRMFDCFCSNVAVIGTFANGTLANFSPRAKWTSSDPTVVSVSNYGDNETGCPLAQRTAGLLRPHTTGTAVVTAEYLGFKPSFTVEVADTAAAAGGTVMLGGDANAVAVGGALQLLLYATLDGRKRYLNNNVMAWSFAPAGSVVADSIAAINQFGAVSGLSPDLGAAHTVTASFGPACTLTPFPTQTVRVGEVVPPLVIAEETDFASQTGPGGASDQRLAVNSNEFLTVTANLDFDGNGTVDGTQNLSGQSRLAFTDPCTTRVYNADPMYASTGQCLVTNTTCPNTPSMSVCAASTATACASTLTTACRVVASPMTVFGTTNVVAVTGSPDPTSFSASFPLGRGVSTTLSSPIGTTDTSLTVASVAGYPTVYPWEGAIGNTQSLANPGTVTPEIVQVTGATGTTLTVVRNYPALGAGQTWPMGTSFDQRTFDTSSGTPVSLTASDGTLDNVAIDLPTGTLPTQGTLQLQATGIFNATATSPANTPATRVQRVSRLSAFAGGSPGVVWSSSNPTIASVGSSGLVGSNSPCGGTVVIRARASTSVDTVDSAFAKPTTFGDAATDTNPANGNTDANDQACLGTGVPGSDNDLLCDQVTLTITRAAQDILDKTGNTQASCDALDAGPH